MTDRLAVPDLRIQTVNDASIRPEGTYVLYWMIANRRGRYNFALQRAAWWARERGQPLIVLEALRSDYRWASDRLHRFAIDGMRDNQRHFAKRKCLYIPYVEPAAGAGRGLLAALASGASVVVTDDFPCFFLPRMVAAAGAALDVRLEAVDSNGLLPMRATDRVFSRAHDFRRFLHKNLLEHLSETPLEDPLRRLDVPERHNLPAGLRERWQPADEGLLRGAGVPDSLPIDHSVKVVGDRPGGSRAGEKRLRDFCSDGLDAYLDDRNQPQRDGTSGLSPYLHFGHVAAHEAWALILDREGWDPGRTDLKANGKREGFWGMAPAVESFLDEIVTWRELGYNMSSKREDYDQFESLPDWALETLARHEDDARDPCYGFDAFDQAQTHDPLWNAAQNQLRRDGRIHNYLRMLWGKKILHWSATPQAALETLTELNNRYALDGRNPNSYSGIFWTLGRYDRAWGPERPVFGKVRYMTSDSTARKYRVRDYVDDLAEWAPE